MIKQYKSDVTIKAGDYTLVEGEECDVNRIEVINKEIMVSVTNSQENRLLIPYVLFKNHFTSIPLTKRENNDIIMPKN